ncbi:MAG: helical backbone metal receptor [Ramlibacter sp.]|nr:helical backbone metal receptor [Ramlibacter sp.]
MRNVVRAWLVALCAFASQAHGAGIVDDRGVALELPRAPQRIVAMLPSLTEMVCELGACDRLVGVDDFSNWPAQVRGLPRLGGLEDTNIERVVALKPDLVLLASSSRAVGRLEGLGIKVATLEPKSLADLRRAWAQLAQVLEVADGAARWQRLEAGVDAAARRLPPALRGTTVYFEVNSAPYAASEASFIGEMLARIGVVNVVPGGLGPFPKLNPEFVVRADPQVIMVSDHDARAIRTRPGWDHIRAVRDGRVCFFDAAQGDVLVRAGPRMGQAAQLMVDCLQRRGPAR